MVSLEWYRGGISREVEGEVSVERKGGGISRELLWGIRRKVGGYQ